MNAPKTHTAVLSGFDKVLSERTGLTQFPSTHARNDLEAIAEWCGLANNANRKSREKEARRFARWLQHRGLGLQELVLADLVEYFNFVQDPPEDWVGPALPFSVNGQPNPRWRPFAGPVKGPSLRQCKTILGSLMKHLVNIGWIARDYTPLVKISALSGNAIEERGALSDACTTFLLGDFFNIWLGKTKFEIDRKIRAKHILLTLLMTGARRSEIALAKMCDVIATEDSWVLQVIGKGNKKGRICLPQSYISNLREYRLYRGLAPSLPERYNSEPLVSSLSDPLRAMTVDGLYKEIKWILRLASNLAPSPSVSEELRKASTHWFRHTHATSLLRSGAPLNLVQKQLRHSDPKTTALYDDSDVTALSKHVEDLYR